MISLRLPHELERQIDYLSMMSGAPKNTILTTAIVQYLKSASLGAIPLEKTVTEQAMDIYLFNRDNQDAEHEKAHKIGDWIQRNSIWTKNPSKATGSVTPGIYGRNVVVGFTETDDRKIAVISRNVSSQSYGTAGYLLTVTTLDDWIEYMMEIPLATRQQR